MNLKRFEELDMQSRVAVSPAEPRDSSRLLVIHKDSGRLEHRIFRDIHEYFRPGDCLILNNSKVFPARLCGKKSTGGKFELLLVRQADKPSRWIALARDCKPGLKLDFPESVRAEVIERTGNGEWVFEFSIQDVMNYAYRNGGVPLPNYIMSARKTAGMPQDTMSDKARYQTVYAKEPGSIAAPTAGFHFTPELLAKIQAAGTAISYVTLHVGWGTFKPIKTAPEQHAMLPEMAAVSQETAELINRTKASGGRVFVSGTTSTRALESFTDADGVTSHGVKMTNLFIYPPYKFRAASCLVTNFHLPDSTPICLAAAFCGGEDLLFKAYSEAVKGDYRFYSFGDATLII